MYRAANRYFCLFVNRCLPAKSGGHGFVPVSSVRVPLIPVSRALPLSHNTLLRWDDDYQVRRTIVLVSRKASTEYCVFLVAFGNAALETARTLIILPAFVSTDASSADTFLVRIFSSAIRMFV